MRLKRPRPRQSVALTQLSFTGMRDSYAPTAADPRKAYLIQNMFPQDALFGGGLVGRPGFRLAASLTGRAQRAYQYTKLDGTEYTVLISGGRVYTYDWVARAATEQVMPTGISLDPTAKVYCVTFADLLVMSDGVSSPITWDGTTFTRLTNCPALFGQPTVYYAKLFGIKASERNVIVWSEENQPNLGYEAGGYNNAWTLGQTDQERLFAIWGTNSALFWWRARSIGMVVGAVTEEFSTTGTQEGVSQTVGTTAPDAIVQHEESIFFIDADAHPQRLVIGAGLQDPPIWLDARETTRLLLPNDLPVSVAAVDEDLGQVIFGVARQNSLAPTHALTFSAVTGEFSSVWRSAGWKERFTTLDTVKDGAARPTLIHGTELGEFRDHGHPDGSTWDDLAAPVEHIVHGTPLAYDPAMTLHFSRADLALMLSTTLTDMKVSYGTPAGYSVEQSVTREGSFALWDEAVWDVSFWPGDTSEVHIAVGLSGEGRWIQMRLRHSGVGEQFGVLGWSIQAHPIGPVPKTP